MLATSSPTTAPPRGGAARWQGLLTSQVLSAQARRGRQRSWVYAAAADAGVTVGAAVVDVGLFGLGSAFAFAVAGDRVHLWDGGPGRAGEVDGIAGSARVERGGGRVELTRTTLRVDVPVLGGRLHADVDLVPGTPVSLVTPTPAGGWNATTKQAGGRASGAVTTPDGRLGLEGGSWTDTTTGRQDRRTRWRWAAGAGSAADGCRVGLQASTGMNAAGPGEDLVWWDDEPYPLTVRSLAPVAAAAPDGPWRLAGDGWALTLAPRGRRAADEGLGPIRSSYVQPIGAWTGTLPGPDGGPVAVTVHGVAEDHDARW